MHDRTSLTTGIWHVTRRSFCGEIWAFYRGTLSIRHLGCMPQRTDYEYDEARGTLALDMSDGTHVVWRVERQNDWQILLHREDAAGNRISQRLQRTIGSSPVLLRTVEILLTRRGRICMEDIPVDLLRAWRISRIRSEQLEALYLDTEAFAVDDEHAGLIAFIHAFKRYECATEKRRSFRRLPMQSAFESYLCILDAWLYLYDRGIVVEDVEPLYVEGYRNFNERISTHIRNL